MAKLFSYISIFCVISLSSFCMCSEFIFEAEKYANGNSSNAKTVRISNKKEINIPFCLRKDGAMDINPVVLGHGNHLNLKIDGQDLSAIGYSSRIPTDMLGVLGGYVFLNRGRHVLTVTSPKAETEVDKIVVDIDDYQLTCAMLHCDVFCIPELPKHSAKPVETAPCAKVVQKSKASNCPEEKNVFIDFYQEHLNKFRITAQHPSYRSLSNARSADRDNCNVLKPTVWQFSKTELSQPKTITEKATLKTWKDTDGCSVYTVYFDITKELHDINVPGIGGFLELKTQERQSDVVLEIRFKYGNEEIALYERGLSAVKNDLKIPVPDRTWKKFENNIEIRACGTPGSTGLSSAKLTRRKLKKDHGETIYDDGEFVVEKTFRDMWWLGDPGMTVSIDGTGITTTAHYLRIYKRVPWGGYSQNLVIYEDGVIRLLPPTTHGADWIPFGTFLLSGRFDPDTDKVIAKINKISVNPKTSELTAYYADGGVWVYKLNVGMDKTEVDVDVKSPMELSHLPFLQLRSMFVRDGKSNVDRMSVDAMPEHRIMDNWNQLYGSSFFFYRGCVSEYHTQSPDTHVQILE